MSQDDGPLDASDRALLAKARSLQSGAPPVPWSGPVVIPAAGALDELSRARRSRASRGTCPSTAENKGKGEYPLLSTLSI